MIRLADVLRFRLLTPALAVTAALGGLVSSAAAQSMPVLAPGVLKTVPSSVEEQETIVGPQPLGELAKAPKWSPNYEPQNATLKARGEAVTIRHPVWQLEMSFKPIRLLEINGTQVWYLLYQVKNNGDHLNPVAEQDEFGNERYVNKPYERDIRFFPMFVLRNHEHKQDYPDRIVAGALQRIHAIEIKDPNVRLHDSVSISRVPIKISSDAIDRGVWGVATWEGIDRRTDFFSVYVQGLNNAYRWLPTEQGDYEYSFKTLQLNFWRPGDAVWESSKEFRYGLPLFGENAKQQEILDMYGLKEKFEYRWIYQP